MPLLKFCAKTWPQMLFVTWSRLRRTRLLMNVKRLNSETHLTIARRAVTLKRAVISKFGVWHGHVNKLWSVSGLASYRSLKSVPRLHLRNSLSKLSNGDRFRFSMKFYYNLTSFLVYSVGLQLKIQTNFVVPVNIIIKSRGSEKYIHYSRRCLKS